MEGRYLSCYRAREAIVRETLVVVRKMSDVIDWDEAMQQCGDDEEFLRELLDDLRSETDTQMSKIQETIDVSDHT